MAESLMAPPPEVDENLLDAGYGEKFEGFASAGSVVKPSDQHAGQQQEMVGSQLARAKEVAQGSGMLRDRLQKLPEDEISSPQPDVSHAVPPVSFPPDSPFQVSDHQDLTEEVPMATQIDQPVVEPQPQQQSEGPQQQPVSQPPISNPQLSSGFSRAVHQTKEATGARGPFLERLKNFSLGARENFGAQAMFLIDNDGQVILDEVGNPKLIQMARTLANASYTASRQSAGAAAVGNLHVKIGANATLEVIPVQSRYGLLIMGVIFPAPLGAERVLQITSLLESAVDPQRNDSLD